jgi:hypothetical protein
MLESWSVSNNDFQTNLLSFNPVIPNLQEKNNQTNSQNVSKDDYMKYGWLFGKR